MASTNRSALNLDPDHISCIGGRTVMTCRDCAGNAPRESICSSCEGRGYTIFICPHCNPAAAAINRSTRSSPTALSSTASTTPGSSAPSSPGSLSRSPSTSYQPHREPRATQSWGRPSDGRNGTSCGRVETNMPRSL